MRIRPLSLSFSSQSAIAFEAPESPRSPAFLNPDVLEHLGKRGHAGGQLGNLFPRPFHERKELQRANQAVAGGVIVEKNDMARLLAAEVITVFYHPFEHISIADRGSNDLNPRDRRPSPSPYCS